MDLEALLKEETELSFGTVDQTKEEVVEMEEKTPAPYKEERYLTEEDKALVDSLVDQINMKDSVGILNFGSKAQQKMADFSEGTLESVRAKDLGQVGDLLNQVVVEIKEFGQEEQKGITGFFKKKTSKLEAMKLRYSKAEVSVDKIVKALQSHEKQLLKDSQVLDQLYELNLKYFRELNMYILAGKKKLRLVMEEELPALRSKAAFTGLAEDAQEVRDLENMSNRFEKKVHDLELTRMVCLQMAPQIRLVQSSDNDMSEKINSTLTNTIPLWKNQMVLALGIEHSKQAAIAHKKVTDMTNELLKRNAEQLKMASIETAKESERGIVDLDTLVKTNEDLIATIDEVIKIQKEGRAKRQEAEEKLALMEQELKQKLLS